MKKLLTTLLFILTACSLNKGTDTGNPEIRDPQGSCGTARCLPHGYTRASMICSKIFSCLNYSIEGCESAVYQQTGLSLEIDLPIETFREADQLIQSNQIVVDHTAANICHERIMALSCESPLLSEAFQQSTPQTYENIHKVLKVDSTCQQTYSLKE